VHTPQKPVETSSLPQGSFCSRCGSRVPPDSAFCNRCGTRVESPATRPAQEPAAAAPESSVPQVSVPMPPVINPMAPHKERPIEDVIHSIEPLIEDSKPRTHPSPLVPSRHSTQVIPAEKTPVPPPALPPETAEEPDSVQKNLAMFSTILVGKPDEQTSVATAAAPASGEMRAPSTESISIPAPGDIPVGTPVLPPRPPTVKRSSKKPLFIAAALIIVVVIALVLGASVFMKGGAGSVLPITTPTPEITVPPTAAPTTAIPTPTPTQEPTVAVATPPPTPAPIIIPDTGVWVRVKYAGTFTGSYGTPGALREVSGTGEQVYQVATSTGVVVASFAKDDGSGDVITTEVYKDGTLVQSDKTTTPRGIAQIQVDLKAAPQATQAPTTP
jgi:hypothetical protein